MGRLAPKFPVALKEMPAYIAQLLPQPPTAVAWPKKVALLPMDGNDNYGDGRVRPRDPAGQSGEGLTAAARSAEWSKQELTPAPYE
jgi:hypothetical protein